MKSLKQYIFEEFQTFNIKDLHVVYDLFNINNKSELCFHLPAVYSESDMQIYMQDILLSDLPSAQDMANEIFGANAKYITDAYFEYKEYNKSEEEHDCIEWEPKADNSHNPDNEEFVYVTISNIKYIIEFSEFNIKQGSSIDTPTTINTIFKAIESSPEYEYPVNIKYNEKETVYKQ